MNVLRFPRPLRYEDLIAKARELEQEAAKMRAYGFDLAGGALEAKALVLRKKAVEIARGGE